jgi:hypothetical protein
MSDSSRTFAITRVPGSRSFVNDRTPVELGRKRGYFQDRETRLLLGLNKGDFLRADGTYGSKELADRPVDFALLREGSYDHRFLPFVPKRRGTARSLFMELRLTNKQWMPMARSLKELWDELEGLRLEAEKIASQTRLPLPEYMYQLLPLIRFELTDSHCFEHQFQSWFNPEAHQARWCHIEQVAGLLEGYANVGNLLLNPDQHAWRHGDPVGIEADSTTFDPMD